MAIELEARHDWWLRALKECAKHRGSGFGGVTVDPEAAQAALDFLEEDLDCDCLGWLDELGLVEPGEYLSMQAVDAILAGEDDASIVAALRAWLVDYKMGAA